MILGALCQRKTIAPPVSPYLIDAQFNQFPFVEDSGHFTINNVNVAQGGGSLALFNATTPQYLEFIGAETFDLTHGIDLELQVRNDFTNAAYESLFELKGTTSYLVVSINNLYAYTLFLTGATGGNSDNYTIIGSLPVPFSTIFNMRIVYDAVAGTLKTYINGTLDINQTGVTQRIVENRVMYLGTVTYGHPEMEVEYFRVKHAT
jgi:hypothetical protein